MSSSSATNPATSSALWIRSLYLTLQAETGQAHNVFNHLCIPFNPIEKNTSRIHVEKISGVWLKSIQLTQDDGFAIKVAQHFVEHGVAAITLAATSCPTLLEAVKRLTMFYKMISTGVVVDINTHNGIAFIVSLPPNHAGICQHGIDATMATILGLANKISSQQGKPLAVTMKRNTPNNPQAFHKYFGCNVEFNAPQNTIVFEGEAAKEPCENQNPVLASHLYSYLNESIKGLDTTTVAQKTLSAMESLFNNLAISITLTMGLVAHELAMSERTLQRKLQLEGTSFKKIDKKFKLEKAKLWLRLGQFQQAEIGDKLGFSSQSNFVRFFKLQTGSTPNQFLQTLPSD